MSRAELMWHRLLSLIPARLRWRLAGALDHLPGTCWANIVQLALAWPKNPRDTSLCLIDVERTGSCYCNKLRRGRP